LKKVLLVVLVVAAVLAALYFAFRSPEGPIVLAYKFKVGDISDYRTTMKAKTDLPFYGAPHRTTVRPAMRRKVLKVNKDGSASILLSSPQCNGNRYLVPWRLHDGIKLTVSRTGQVTKPKRFVKFLIENGPPGDYPATALLGYTAVLPRRGVRVGQTWSATIPFPVGGGDIGVNSTLVSDRWTLGNRRVCKIESRYEGTLDAGRIYPKSKTRAMGDPDVSGEIRISGEGTLYFSREEGRVIRHDDKVSMASTITEGKPPGAGGSPTGASLTLHVTAEAEYRAVLVEKKSKPGS